jgi:hypothetical protein
MEILRGHYLSVAGDRETVPICTDGKGAEAGRNDRPARLWREVTVCFLLGSLVAHAPFYSGILQGLQVSDTTPYS